MVELNHIHTTLFSDYKGRATTLQLVQATGETPEAIAEALEQHDEESNAPFAVVGERSDEFGCHYWICAGDATYEDFVFDMRRIQDRIEKRQREIRNIVANQLLQFGRAPTTILQPPPEA